MGVIDLIWVFESSLAYIPIPRARICLSENSSNWKEGRLSWCSRWFEDSLHYVSARFNGAHLFVNHFGHFVVFGCKARHFHNFDRLKRIHCFSLQLSALSNY